MSKRINVNPDHYKVSGRERPGKDIVPEAERQQFKQTARESKRKEPSIPNQERAGARRRPRRRTESS
jgi:hypothetical protein